MSHSKIDADLIMLSNFDRWGGGMETWAYGFLPSFLQSYSKLHLTIYGLTTEKLTDNTQELINAMDPLSSHRLVPVFLQVKWPGIPLFFSMIYRLRKISKNKITPKFVLGVGGLFELLNMLYVQKYKKSTKIIWLRTIFFNEKATRVPKIMLPICRRIEAHFLRKVDIILANGDDIAEYYKQFGLHVHVVKNGVDSKRWCGEVPDFSGPIKIAFVGRLAKVKGIVEFLNMVKLAKASQNANQFEFIVIGHGPYADDVSKLKAQGLLSYDGSVDNNDLPAVLREIDVCVGLTFSLSTNGGGGTSNALLEQMSSGRLILAWDNIIFRQLLNEENSFLVKQGDVAALVEVLNYIVSEKAVSQKKATKGKELMNNFSLESQLNNFNIVAQETILADPN